MKPLLGLIIAVALSSVATSRAAETWTETRWHDERAWETRAEDWRAIVSIDRGRLVHFGPAGSNENLLFAPADRTGVEGFGGHRVWAGPQREWPKIWPPAKSWENDSAAATRVDGNELILEMGPSPEGWPRIVRTYSNANGHLVCRVTLTGGARDAQVIQILQTPPETEVELKPVATEAAPEGAVQLPSSAKPVASVHELKQIQEAGSSWKIHYTGSVVKLGFAPQAIIAHGKSATLVCARGKDVGRPTGAPDNGLYTQLYLGAKGHAELIELEQLSPLWDHQTEASSEIILDLRSN